MVSSLQKTRTLHKLSSKLLRGGYKGDYIGEYYRGKSVYFLLSGLFCCLGVSGVIFFAVWAGGCVFFAVWAGGVCFLLFGRGACFFFAVWAGRVLFLLFGRGRVLFFAVWAGGVFCFLLFGRGTGVHSLTRLPGSSLSDPTTKETEKQKTKTRVPVL